ncbi:MAG: hypothetical protein ACREJO_01860 [Phycisphaerales bacterium]
MPQILTTILVPIGILVGLVALVVGYILLRLVSAMRTWSPTDSKPRYVDRDDPWVDPRLSAQVSPLVSQFAGRGYVEVGRVLSEPGSGTLRLDVFMVDAATMIELTLSADLMFRSPNINPWLWASFESRSDKGERLITSNSMILACKENLPDRATSLVAVGIQDSGTVEILHGAHARDVQFACTTLRRSAQERLSEAVRERGRLLQRMMTERQIVLSPDQKLMRHRWRYIVSRFGQVFSSTGKRESAAQHKRAEELLLAAGLTKEQFERSMKRTPRA